MTHLTDMAVNRQQDAYLDEGNDLAIVSGLENTKQSAALQVLDETDDLIGEVLNGNQLTKLRGRIRTELQADPELSTVHEVKLVSIDDNKNKVNIEVKAEPSDVELTIPVPEN